MYLCPHIQTQTNLPLQFAQGSRSFQVHLDFYGGLGRACKSTFAYYNPLSNVSTIAKKWAK